MVKILRTRVGQHKGARIRLEAGEVLTAAHIKALDSDIVSLVVDAGTYDTVSGSVVGGTAPVDISILSEVQLPIVTLVIGGQFVREMPDLSGWTALRNLTVMNTLVDRLDVSGLNLTNLHLESNTLMSTLDDSLNEMQSLQILGLVEMPLTDMSWIAEDNLLSNLTTLYIVDMQQMEEFPQELEYLSALESLSVERSAFILTDEDVDRLVDRTRLSYLSVSPDQIDFDVSYAEDDMDLTVNVAVDDTY